MTGASAATYGDASNVAQIVVDANGRITGISNVAITGGGGISNVVEDTTPQLGGDLDLNSSDITGTGNVNITGIITATSFSGGGASLTSLNASNISSGTISDARLPATITSNITGDLTGNADTATTSTNVTVADESTDTSCNVLFVTAATGNLPPKSGTNLTFNSSNGTLTATEFSGGGSGLTGITASQVGALADVVSDTTPQLGGDLDLNSSDITGTGNVNITGTITASGDIQTDGAFRAESSNSTERFEIAYNETTDSLDFSYFAS